MYVGYITTHQKRKKIKMSSSFPPVYIKGEVIKEVNHHKILDVTLDKNLLWSDHITSINYQKLNIILDINSRKLFFFTHTFFPFLIMHLLWDNTSENNVKLPSRYSNIQYEIKITNNTNCTLLVHLQSND